MSVKFYTINVGNLYKKTHIVFFIYILLLVINNIINLFLSENLNIKKIIHLKPYYYVNS